MNKYFIAIYIDLENTSCRRLELDLLIRTLELESDDQNNLAKPVFAIKAAYGALDSISAEIKDKLMAHGFYMVNTPHLGEKKNRADLFISLDAFESLYVNNPVINQYIFLSSDSDFTVIGEKLRKYGRNVWLVCRRADRQRAILSNAFDKLLYLEDYYQSPQSTTQLATNPEIQENDCLAKDIFLQVLRTIDLDKLPCNISIIHDRMMLSDPGLDMRNTSFRKFAELAKYFEDHKVIVTNKDKNWLLTDINLNQANSLKNGKSLE